MTVSGVLPLVLFLLPCGLVVIFCGLSLPLACLLLHSVAHQVLSLRGVLGNRIFFTLSVTQT